LYPTTEVRWFYCGALPTSVERWFERGRGDAKLELPRVDHYLRPRGSDGLNIKVREGRLEIKQRVREGTETQFSENVVGAVEHWQKWGFDLVGTEADSLGPIPSPAWVAVRKERSIRTYALDGRPAPAPPDPVDATVACEWELTRVEVCGEIWWTTALEAFGDETRQREAMLSVAKLVFGLADQPPLRIEHSRGYSAWLDRLTEGTD
jgi:hypothetical protein